jgi:hypothetical protein
VREVKKKVLGIAVALMAAAMLATPMIATAQAWGLCRPKVVPYSAAYETQNVGAPDSEVKGDYLILTNGEGVGAYSGTIGEGTVHGFMIKTVIYLPTGEGWQLVKNTIEITAGDYGTGTLVGYGLFKLSGGAMGGGGGRIFLSGRLGGKWVTVSAERSFTPIPPPPPIPGHKSVSEEGWMTIR